MGAIRNLGSVDHCLQTVEQKKKEKLVFFLSFLIFCLIGNWEKLNWKLKILIPADARAMKRIGKRDNKPICILITEDGEITKALTLEIRVI